MVTISELYGIFQHCSGISTDSRNIQANSLFVALKGEAHDGNHYASEALEKGAAYALVSKTVAAKDPRFIKVDDTLKALQQLATFHRRQLGTKILAITGSNGKTTSKELCKAVLGQQYTILATAGNLNNHIGVPLTLLSMKREHEIGVIEMGANHEGEIDMLCRIALPDAGLITNIGKAHLEGFGSIEGVTRSKGELFRHLVINKKVIFCNFGDRYLKDMVLTNYHGLIPYNGNSQVYAREIHSMPFLKINAYVYGKNLEVSSNLVGKYNLENIVAALAVGSYFRVQPDAMVAAIENYYPSNNRSQLIEKGRNRIIMDAYNANPSSMMASINNFKEMDAENKILIIGQMNELGADSDYEHAQLLRQVNALGFTRVYLVGEEFTEPNTRYGYPHFMAAGALVEVLKLNPVTDAYLLIKGSRGNKLEEVLAVL